MRPEPPLPYVPQLLGGTEGRPPLASVLPPQPLDMTMAFRLSGLHVQVQEALS